jgi:hypothetical protein
VGQERVIFPLWAAWWLPVLEPWGLETALELLLVLLLLGWQPVMAKESCCFDFLQVARTHSAKVQGFLKTPSLMVYA